LWFVVRCWRFVVGCLFCLCCSSCLLVSGPLFVLHSAACSWLLVFRSARICVWRGVFLFVVTFWVGSSIVPFVPRCFDWSGMGFVCVLFSFGVRVLLVVFWALSRALCVAFVVLFLAGSCWVVDWVRFAGGWFIRPCCLCFVSGFFCALLVAARVIVG